MSRLVERGFPDFLMTLATIAWIRPVGLSPLHPCGYVRLHALGSLIMFRPYAGHPVWFVFAVIGSLVVWDRVMSLAAFGRQETPNPSAFAFEGRVIDPEVGKVCYALTIADVNNDQHSDLLALTEESLYVYLAPAWTKARLIDPIPPERRDGVCVAARDLDGDGRPELVVGSGWRPFDTTFGGWLELYRSDASEPLRYRKIAELGQFPTLHRIRFGPTGIGPDPVVQLVITPIFGVGGKGPDWETGPASRIEALTPPPPDRLADPWTRELLDESLHVVHNLAVVDFLNDGPPYDVLLAARQGVFVLTRTADGKWIRTQIGSGSQDTTPAKGASEIKLGRLADGTRMVATVEPFHGDQVVIYTEPRPTMKITPPLGETADEPPTLWNRAVIDRGRAWGHGLWFADLDGDGDEELVFGQRDPTPQAARATDPNGPRGPAVMVFDPQRERLTNGSSELIWTRHLVDDGGVAVEDLLVHDLDGDGKPDLAAGGRATRNVKIYLNRTPPRQTP